MDRDVELFSETFVEGILRASFMKNRSARKTGPMRKFNTLPRRVQIVESGRQRPVGESVEK